MQLTYRGNSYDVPAPVQIVSDSKEQPKIKLIYRGNIIDYTPRPNVISEVDKTDWLTATFTYRGNTYERKIQHTQPDQKPRAINWRWQ